MNNYHLKNNIKIKITGKNINSYLKRIIKYKINIIKHLPLNYQEAYLIISYDDYLKLLKYKSIYKIEIIKTYGKIRLKEIIKKNIIIIFSFFVSLSFIFFLSNIIFEIEIIHTNHNLVLKIEKELKKHNIEKYKFKKKYQELELIEDSILKDNKDILEWIEIIPNGTKYIIKLEERLIKKENNNSNYQHIIVNKSAIITDIDAYSGEKVKNINDYVKKGDVVISGSIPLTNGSIYNTKAQGRVYGEVWYTIKVEYPYIYYEEFLTGKTRELYVLHFLNKNISLFNYQKYESFNYLSKTIFSDNIIPLSLRKEKQYEVKVIEEIYTEEEVINKAIEHGKKKLLMSNERISKIKDITIIKQESTSSKITLTLFISVIEQIDKIEEFTENIQ